MWHCVWKISKTDNIVWQRSLENIQVCVTSLINLYCRSPYFFMTWPIRWALQAHSPKDHEFQHEGRELTSLVGWDVTFQFLLRSLLWFGTLESTIWSFSSTLFRHVAKRFLILLRFSESINLLKVCGKTVNYRFSYFLPFIAVNLSFRMDKNKNLNYRLSKTIHNFHYRIAIKTT